MYGAELVYIVSLELQGSPVSMATLESMTDETLNESERHSKEAQEKYDFFTINSKSIFHLYRQFPPCQVHKRRGHSGTDSAFVLLQKKEIVICPRERHNHYDSAQYAAEPLSSDGFGQDQGSGNDHHVYKQTFRPLEREAESHKTMRVPLAG